MQTKCPEPGGQGKETMRRVGSWKTGDAGGLEEWRRVRYTGKQTGGPRSRNISTCSYRVSSEDLEGMKVGGI